MTVINLAPQWTRTMHTVNTAAVDLLTGVLPDLQVICHKGADVFTYWETSAHSGNLDINAGRTVHLVITPISDRSAARIVTFVCSIFGADPLKAIAELPTGTHHLPLDGEQRGSSLLISSDRTLNLDLCGLSLEHACSILAALSVPDTVALGTCLCILPDECCCTTESTPITEGHTDPSANAKPAQQPNTAVPIGDEYRCDECGELFTIKTPITFRFAETLDANGEPRVCPGADTHWEDIELGCDTCGNYPEITPETATMLDHVIGQAL